MQAYQLAGLKLVSGFELPGVPRWNGPAQQPADIVFRQASVPLNLSQAEHVAALFEIRGREYLVSMPDICRLLIRDGSEIEVSPAPNSDPADIGSILTGPIQAVLWHQRALLPLHAVAIASRGEAIALAGPSGCGKSTLAAALTRRGYRVIADDLCVVDASAASAPAALPISPLLRLWRQALDDLGIAPDGLRRVLSTREKFFVDRGADLREPVPLRAIVLVARRRIDAVKTERLRGVEAVAALDAAVLMRRPARALGRDPAIFAAVTALARTVSVWQLAVPDDPNLLEIAAAAVAEIDR